MPARKGTRRRRVGEARSAAATTTKGRTAKALHEHGKTEEGAAYHERAGAPAQPVPLEDSREPEHAQSGTEGLEHHGALVDQAHGVHGHGTARDGNGKDTAVAQHPTERHYANRLDQRHDNPGGGKSRRSAHGTGPQSKREHGDGHARRLVVYEVTVRENPMSEADRGAEPHAVVVLEVLVQLPQPEQLVPAHSKAESSGHAHDQSGDRKATSLQPGRDAAPRAFPDRGPP